MYSQLVLANTRASAAYHGGQLDYTCLSSVFLKEVVRRARVLYYQDTFDHDKGQKSVISGEILHWIFEFSPVDLFPFSPGLLRNLVRKSPQNVRPARVQNETAPENFLNRYEKRFETREKGSEKRSETRLKNF